MRARARALPRTRGTDAARRRLRDRARASCPSCERGYEVTGVRHRRARCWPRRARQGAGGAARSWRTCVRFRELGALRRAHLLRRLPQLPGRLPIGWQAAFSIDGAQEPRAGRVCSHFDLNTVDGVPIHVRERHAWTDERRPWDLHLARAPAQATRPPAAAPRPPASTCYEAGHPCLYALVTHGVHRPAPPPGRSDQGHCSSRAGLVVRRGAPRRARRWLAGAPSPTRRSCPMKEPFPRPQRPRGEEVISEWWIKRTDKPDDTRRCRSRSSPCGARLGARRRRPGQTPWTPSHVAPPTQTHDRSRQLGRQATST